MPLEIDSFQEFNFDTAPDVELLPAIKRSLNQGFFYFKIPVDCQKLLPGAMLFGQTLESRKEGYKKLDVKPPFGFEQRKATQAYALCLRKDDWCKAYVGDELKLADEMHRIGVKVFKFILNYFKIPQADWDRVTGMAHKEEGKPVFTVLSFSPHLNASKGLIPHRDIGWVTVLMSDKDGLQVQIDEKWHAVPLKQDHFIVMFGGAMERLINNKEQLNAPTHHVEKLQIPRVTLALFINSSDKKKMYSSSDGIFVETGETFEGYVQGEYKTITADQQRFENGS